MKSKILFLVLISLTISIGLNAEEAKVSKTKRLKINFDEDLINGKAASPDLNYIQTRKESKFKKMIKVRDNFIPEVETDGGQLGNK